MQHVALLPRHVPIAHETLALVAAALDLQLRRDLAPAWGIDARCAAFDRIEEVPFGHLFVFVVEDGQGRAGLHFRPTHIAEPAFGIVQHQPDGQWSAAASHEVIELLVDPVGDRLFTGPDPMDPSRSVDFLAEPCDPCQHPAFDYEVDPDWPVRVSDFCLPSFYGWGAGEPPYSFRGHVTAPASVAMGGYLSWRDGEGRWFQMRALGGPPRIVGPLDEAAVFGDAANPGLRMPASTHGEASETTRNLLLESRLRALGL